jgi:ABC-type glycerol-3-phosphate transport system substrate-binding protein
MKNRRILCLILGLVLITVFASSLVWGADKQVKTFTLYYGGSDARPVDLFQTKIGKKITELTGVTMKIEYIVGSDEQTKAGIMIASGQYPDLIFAHNVGHKFIEAGALLPLDDYIAKSDIVKKAYKGNLKKLRWTDGHIYWLSPWQPDAERLYANDGFWLPIDLLKENGWPMVTDIDQYFNLIRNYVKKHPTYNGKPTIGFTCEADDWRIYILKQSGIHLAGYFNTGETIIDKENTAHCYEVSADTKNYLKRLNQLYLEGLFDKEAFSQNYDQYQAKIAEGRVIGFYDERWQFQDAAKSLEQQELFGRCHVAMPVVYKGVKQNPYGTRQIFSNISGVSISKDCKDPDAAFKFLERFLADDIQKLNYWGLEGDDYNVVNGRMVKSEKQILQGSDPDYLDKQGLLRFQYLFPRIPWGEKCKYADGNFVSPNDSPEYFAFQYKPYEKEVLKAYKKETFANFMSPPTSPPYGYVWDIPLPDSSPERIVQQKLDDLSRKYVSKVVMAPKGQFEKIWSQYVADFKKINYKLVEKYYTDAVQKRIKDWAE